MKNLAGNPLAPAYAARELQLAGIEIEPAETVGEVPANLRGRLGDFTFERAWYYWRVSGPMSLQVAQDLFDSNEEVRKSVRACGHCGRLRPGEPGARATYLTADGEPVVNDPDGSQEARFREWSEKYDLPMQVFSRDPIADGCKAFIDGYDVDTQEGLNILAQTIRSL